MVQGAGIFDPCPMRVAEIERMARLGVAISM
jgi:hypothetical protein